LQVNYGRTHGPRAAGNPGTGGHDPPLDLGSLLLPDLLRSPRTRFRDYAWEAANHPEPQRRRAIFGLVAERLRYGATADCTVDEPIALGYRKNCPSLYWRLWFDTSPSERIGISLEHFLEPCTRPACPADPASCGPKILRLPSIQAVLARAKNGLAREALCDLAAGPDYGARIIGPPLRRALGFAVIAPSKDGDHTRLHGTAERDAGAAFSTRLSASDTEAAAVIQRLPAASRIELS
jgi:hypothetical protein